MIDTLRHLASFADFAAHRGDRERHDAAVFSELAAQAAILPKGLEITWLGTAGFKLSYEQQVLYIDPYLSRIPLRSLFGSRPVHPDPALLDKFLDRPHERVVGILVGHCHFDHAIDAPAIAMRCHAPAYGSKSLAQLMALHGAQDLAVTVEAHRRYELGPYTVRFVPSLHSKLVLGYRVPFEGEFTCDHVDALTPSAYKCGQVWGMHIEVAGTTLYHQGSANLIDEEIKCGSVDVFLAGVAGRRFTRDYWPRVLRRLQPRVIIASHFDDFFRPLDAPMAFSANVNLAAVPEEIHRVDRDIRVVTLRPLQELCIA
jgi:L-ascorbate metabolism protein UlaG (beta-lactamase superfamily)